MIIIITIILVLISIIAGFFVYFKRKKQQIHQIDSLQPEKKSKNLNKTDDFDTNKDLINMDETATPAASKFQNTQESQEINNETIKSYMET